jgi:hypothetical protein
MAREKQAQRSQTHREFVRTRRDFYQGNKNEIIEKYEREKGPLSDAAKRKFLERTFWSAPIDIPHMRETKVRTQALSLFVEIGEYKKRFEAKHIMTNKNTFEQRWRSPKLQEYPWEEYKQKYPQLFTREGSTQLRMFADYFVKRAQMQGDFFPEQNEAVRKIIRQFQRNQS